MRSWGRQEVPECAERRISAEGWAADRQDRAPGWSPHMRRSGGGGHEVFVRVCRSALCLAAECPVTGPAAGRIAGPARAQSAGQPRPAAEGAPVPAAGGLAPARGEMAPRSAVAPPGRRSGPCPAGGARHPGLLLPLLPARKRRAAIAGHPRGPRIPARAEIAQTVRRPAPGLFPASLRAGEREKGAWTACPTSNLHLTQNRPRLQLPAGNKCK